MELETLYRELILDHARNPRHNKPLDHADAQAEAFNPLCGDRLELMLRYEDETIAQVGMRVRACAICQAAASLTGDCIIGMAKDKAGAHGEALRSALGEDGGDLPEALQPMAPLLHLRSQRSRHRCITLVWDALDDCLDQKKS